MLNFNVTVSAPATSGEDVRIGTTNASSTGTYDSTAQGCGPTWTDGTYALGAGEVVVTSGVGVFDGAQEAGTYTCGNRQVVCSATTYACANTTQWNSIVSQGSGALDDWVVVIRRAAGITDFSNTSSKTTVYNTEAAFEVSGDGTIAATDAASHAHFDNVKLDRTKGIKISNIQFVACRPGTTLGTERVWWDGCLFGKYDPDITDSTPPSYSGEPEPFWCESSLVGCMFTNCTFRGYGNSSGIGSLLEIREFLVFVGNNVIKHNGDGIRFRTETGQTTGIGLVGGNNFAAGFAAAGGGAHMDDFQLENFHHEQTIFEANTHALGPDSVGASSAQSYHDTTPAVEGCVRANMMMSNDGSGFGMRSSSVNGGRFHYNGVLPEFLKASTDWTSNKLGLQIQGNGSPGIYADGNYGDLTTSNVTNTGDANVDIAGYTQAAMDASFPNHTDALSSVPTWFQIRDAHVGADGSGSGGANFTGKGAGDKVTNSGTLLDEYVMDSTLAPAPVLSSFSATTSGSNFTGSVSTTVDEGFVRWVIIPNADSISASDWKELLAGHIPNALEYGFTGSRTTGTHSSFGGSDTLASGTYKVAIMHFNGWSRRSNMLTDTFTV